MQKLLSSYRTLLLETYMCSYLAGSFGTLLYLLTSRVEGIFHVEIASIGVRRSGSFLSFFDTGPGIDLGMEDLRSIYNQTFSVNHTYLYYARDRENCYESSYESDALLSQWFYTKKRPADLYAFIAANCADQVNINRLASGWNTLFISGYGTDNVVRHKDISPTWITTSPSSRVGYTRLFANLFARYQWSSIYVVYDIGNFSSYIYYATIFNTQLQAEISNMQLTFREIDSRGPLNYSSILTEFRQTSRVMVFMSPGGPFRQFLLEARANGMTTGEYVYIGFKMFRYDQFGLMDWQYGDEDDEVAREAFRSALLVSVNATATVVPARLFDSYIARTQRRFNVTLRNIDTAVPWPVVASTYSGFLILGQVLNETLRRDPTFDFQNGSEFTKFFLNRTYHLPHTDIHLDEVGERTPPLIVEDLDVKSGLFKTVIVQDNTVLQLHDIAEIDWGGPPETSKIAPTNVPACGYSGDRGPCSLGYSARTPVAASLTILVLLALLLYFKRRYYNHGATDARWWCMEETRLRLKPSSSESEDVIVKSNSFMQIWQAATRRKDSMTKPRASDSFMHMGSFKLLI